MNTFIWLSFILLVLFLGVGAIDGVYFHLQKYKLFAHKESRFEHLLHSLRALLIIPTIFLLYTLPCQGWQLYLALGLVLIDLVLMVIDVLVEYKSRANLGGLTRAEYTIHMIANSLHMIAITLAFASRPMDYWQLSYSGLVKFSPPEFIKTIASVFVVTTTLGAIHHLLLLHPRFSKSSENIKTTILSLVS